MLILRIWYLFPHNKFIQYGMVILWVFSVAISLAYTSVAAMGLRLLNTSLFMQGAPGCRVARPVKFWRMFMPSLGLHTILYIMTAVRALRNRRILKDAPVLKRLLRDIHSLASHLGSETGWLLSNVELRRTNWRKGATEGELIVECNSYDDYDDRESNLQINNGSLRSYRALKVSRVGVFNDDTMWL
ncbi:hypothetical protein HHX47_DHR1001834 [Lentinula edodes]|nr:hypothetical protein HHX47_DHR1001834 [Lentinula edodes]